MALESRQNVGVLSGCGRAVDQKKDYGRFPEIAVRWRQAGSVL